MHVDFHVTGAAERDHPKAQKVKRQAPQGRRLEAAGRQYWAYSAHELLEFEADNNTRPGFLS